MKMEFLEGSLGSTSSKRVFTFILQVLFVIIILANLFLGKNLNPTLLEYFFYLMLYYYTGVATEKVINGVAKKLEAPKEKEVKSEVL